MENYLFISDAAKEVKVESHVLRYWEEELHLPIKRNELGHRYYTEEDVERFKQIKGMKERGLQLKAIKMILKDGKLDMLVPRQKPEDSAEKGTAAQSENTNAERNAAQGLREQDNARGARQNVMQNARKDILSEPERDMAQNAAQNRNCSMPQSRNQNMTQNRNQNMVQNRNQGMALGRGQSTPQTAGRSIVPAEMPIDIVAAKDTVVSASDKEEKSRRLQWLLQQLIRETLQENNSELCREIKESVVKELDYQFRMQEEREEARDRLLVERSEEHYRQMDELLRKKANKKGLRKKAGKKAEPETESKNDILECAGENMPEESIPDVNNTEKPEKKKKRFIF